MSADEMRNDGKLGPLMTRLEELGLADLVWAVIGGHPSRLYNLVPLEGDKLAAAATSAVTDALRMAINDSTDLVREGAFPDLKIAIDAFASSRSGTITVTDELEKLSKPRVNKVYRRVQGTFVGTTPAMELVLSHGRDWITPPSPDELKPMCDKAWSKAVIAAKSWCGHCSLFNAL